MAKKKVVEVVQEPVSHLDDKKYHALLVEHLTLCELWSALGNEAARRYPDQLSKREAALYKLTVETADQCDRKYHEIVKLNAFPQPEHRLTPLSTNILFPKDTDAEKWLKETDKKLQTMLKQCEKE